GRLHLLVGAFRTQRMKIWLPVLATVFAACCVHSAEPWPGVVTRVSDGDTLWVRPASGGKPRKVRIDGIDAPEICQIWGPQSRDALAKRLLRQTVLVQVRSKDSYDRTLANLKFRGEDVGDWMVKRGYAWSYHYQRNVGPYPEQEMQARANRRGLFAHIRFIRPREFRKEHGACK
ncbi:MAG TPA: thermonuclease family protein, partial [Burkholderiaceae bacterium]|nr:thermonuclease family protein [Burkholderiaceae bacterium]